MGYKKEEEIFYTASGPLVPPSGVIFHNGATGECVVVEFQNPDKKKRRKKKQTISMAPSPYDDLVRRLAVIEPPSQGAYASYKIGQSEDINRIFKLLINEPQEVLYVVSLNNRHVVLGITEVSRGGLTSAMVDQRVFFAAPLLLNAAAIIVVHNHPSGYSEPSSEDYALVRKIQSGCEIFGLRLLDSVVIGDGDYVSMADRGVL